MQWRDRAQAGDQLAERLEKYREQQPVVLALPRGGVEAAVPVARRLRAPLDLLIVHKLGHPLNPEFAACAVAESGQLACSPEALADLGVDWLEGAARRAQAEAKRQRQLYLAGRLPVPVEGRTAIIADDGIATGLSMIAAATDVRTRQPARVVAAVPVLPREAAQQLAEYVDELVALEAPEEFAGSVGAYYEQFDQVSDEEVLRLLASVGPDS